MRALPRARGFTLIEVLTASLLMGFVAIWTYQALMGLRRNADVMSAETQANEELRGLLADISRQFDMRVWQNYLPPGPRLSGFSALVSPAFNLVGLSPCRGLQIYQYQRGLAPSQFLPANAPPLPISANEISVQYNTQCVPYTGNADRLGAQVHRDLVPSCYTGGVPQVTVTTTNPNTGTTTVNYPLTSPWAVGTAVCFRFQTVTPPYTVSVEAGESYFNGQHSGVVSSRILLSEQDRGPGVYLVPF